MLDLIGVEVGEICVAGTTLSIVENSALMTAFNASISALFRDINGNYKIVVDNSFHKRPEYVRKFFIAHEVGHYIHGDLDNPDDANARHAARLSGEIQSTEFAADEYAASQLTKVELFKTADYLYSLSITMKKTIDKMVKRGELTPEREFSNRNAVTEIKLRAAALSKLVGKRFVDDLFNKGGV